MVVVRCAKVRICTCTFCFVSLTIYRYSDTEIEARKLFHTDGLMRTKLSPDASKLIMSTAGGYLMVIHDLDLDRFPRDMQGFQPNVYRLMQISDHAIRSV